MCIRKPWILFISCTLWSVSKCVSCSARTPIVSVFIRWLIAVHLCFVLLPAAPLIFWVAIFSVPRVVFPVRFCCDASLLRLVDWVGGSRCCVGPGRSALAWCGSCGGGALVPVQTRHWFQWHYPVPHAYACVGMHWKPDLVSSRLLWTSCRWYPEDHLRRLG